MKEKFKMNKYNLLSSTENKLLPFYNWINQKIGPITLTVYPTNKCNLNCEFCGMFGRPKNQSLSLKKFKNIIKSLPSLLSVEFSGGGEPLMHPQINKFIEFTYNQNLSIGLITNGVNLSKELPLKKLNWIRISINGLIDKEIPINFNIILLFYYVRQYDFLFPIQFLPWFDLSSRPAPLR